MCDGRREAFTFLGYIFGPMRYRKTGHAYLGAAPAKKAVKRIKGRIRQILHPGDFVANSAAAGVAPNVIRRKLDDLLTPYVAESGERGARSKTITVLGRLWLVPDSRTDRLRRHALETFLPAVAEERLALHWGLAMAVYPFFCDVVSVIGRLLKLQGTASLSEVVRRTKEKWGDRERVARSARHVLQSVRDWAVLAPAGSAGVYQAALPRRPLGNATSWWILEALLLGSGLAMAPRRQLVQSPAIFPFVANVVPTDLARDAPLELTRHGGEEEIVALRHSTT